MTFYVRKSLAHGPIRFGVSPRQPIEEEGPLPRGVSRVQAAVMDFVPGKPFSTDNFLSATLDSTCEADGLAALGIPRTPLRGTIDTYLR